jgi:hypothetical protein
VRELDPDVLTGWNVVDFDLTVLGADGRAPARGPGARPRGGGVRLRPAGSRGAAQASVPAASCSTAST